MLAYIVTMRNGRRYTVKAEELRFNCEGTLELLATPTRTEGEPFPGRQVVALFSAHDVV